MPGAGITVLGCCTGFEVVEGEEPQAVAKRIEATANDDSNTRPLNFRRKLLLNHPPWRWCAGCRGSSRIRKLAQLCPIRESPFSASLDSGWTRSGERVSGAVRMAATRSGQTSLRRRTQP